MTPASEWARCKHHIEAALDYYDRYGGATHGIEDIERGIEAGDYQFWPGVRSAVITEISVYPKFTALHFFLVGGDLQEIREMEPVICAWGKEVGCSKVITIERPGWSKEKKSLGYRTRLVTWSEKDL